MGTCFLYGNGGGGSKLNFSIKRYATKAELLADAPKEYTIGVVTEIPVTIWIMNSAPGVWSTVYGSIDIVFESSAYYDDTTINTRIFSGRVGGVYGEAWIKPTGCYQSDGTQNIAVNAYIYKNGSWLQFSEAFAATINVTYPAGSTCTATDGTTTLTAPDTSGSWACTVPNAGTWTVTATDGSSTATSDVTISSSGESQSATLAYTGIPEFSYTGTYAIVDDSNNPITETTGNWKIRFLTSGTLTFSNLKGASSGIDIFCVGGGGGGSRSGACGGYTTTVSAQDVAINTDYIVTVGAGGAAGAVGGASSFSSLASASGGGSAGGYGGSGGGGAGYYSSSSNKSDAGNGGSDGSNGINGYGTSGFKNGYGQGTTTREFGESTGTLYAGGGGGAGSYDVATGSGGAGGGGGGGYVWTSGSTNGKSGTTNTGGGGGGGNTGGTGGSGIVIIRNKR